MVHELAVLLLGKSVRKGGTSGRSWLGVVLMLAASLLTGCKLIDDLLAGSSGGATTVRAAPPPGSGTGCDLTAAERQALVDLVLTPVSCSDTEPCPKGSFCDAEHNHTCNWQCLSNSDCGTGTCECDGKCSDSPSTPPPGDSTAASCPRDNALLDAVKAEPRRCEWDDECPYGAHCDLDFGRCDWLCRNPDSACPSGQTCDCLGNCIEADAPPERPGQRLPSLEVSSRTVTVLGDQDRMDWRSSVAVELATGDEHLLTGTGEERTFEATVSVVAGPRLLVSCNATASTPTYATECELSGFRFRKDQSLWVGSQALLIKPAAETADVPPDRPEPFTIRLHSARAADSPRTVTVAFDPITTPFGWDPVEVSTFTEKTTFSGKLSLHAPSDLAIQGHDVAPVDVGIEAAILPSCNVQGEPVPPGPCLLIHDPLKTLSSGTLMRLPLDRTGRYFRVLESTSPSIRGSDTGVPFTLTSLSKEAKSGDLSGVITRLNEEFEGKYTAASLSVFPKELPGCSSDDDCDAGEQCLLGTFCGVTREGPTSQPSPGSLLKNVASDDWTGAFSQSLAHLVRQPGFVGSDLLRIGPRLYDPVVGVAAPNSPGLFPDRDFLGAHMMAPFLRTFPGSLEGCALSIRAMLRQLITLRRPTQAEEDQAVSQACFTLAADAKGIACRDTNLPQLVDLPGACVDDSGHAVPCTTQEPESSPYSCSTLFQNLNLGGGFPDTFQEFCAPSTFTIQEAVDLGGGFVEEQTVRYSIWVCDRWEEVAFPSSTGAPEAALCYPNAPQRASFLFPILGSSPFDRFSNSLPLRYSGDLNCRAPGSDATTLPSGADLLMHRDIYDNPFRAGDLLSECLANLSRSPDIELVNGQVPNFAQLYSTGVCLSPASFYTALDAASAGWNRDTRPDERNVRVFLRLMQQWAELNAFVANQARQELELTRQEAAVPEPNVAPSVDLEQVLNQLDAAATLIVTQPWLVVPADLVRNPSYRPLQANEAPEWEQQYGPAPALLELATAHYNALELYARIAAQSTYEDSFSGVVPTELKARLSRFGDGLRFASSVERLSTELYDRANVPIPCGEDADCAESGADRCVSGTCVASRWTERWLSARNALAAARSRAVAMGATLAAGENPLGISENDLPLFFGDLTGTNSRFFASSDYLMSTWAVSAVESARGALADAREAWINQRNSRIQDTLLEADRDRRLETIRSDAGATIAANCGLPGGVAADQVLQQIADGTIDVHNCWLVSPEENPACVPPADTAPPATGVDTQALIQCYREGQVPIQDNNLQAAGFFKNACNAWFRDHDLTPKSQTIQSWVTYQDNTVHGCVGECDPVPTFMLGFLIEGATTGSGAPNGDPQSLIDEIIGIQRRKGLQQCSGPFWNPLEHEFVPCGQPAPDYVCQNIGNSKGCISNRLGTGLALRPAVQNFNCDADQYTRDRANALRAYDLSGSQSGDLIQDCRDRQGFGIVSNNVRRPTMPFECFRGGLGSSALRLLKAQQEADLVDVLWAEKQLEYKIQGEQCVSLQEDANRLAQARARFNEQMESFRQARRAMGRFSEYIGGAVKAVETEGASLLDGDLIWTEIRHNMDDAMAHITEQHQAFLQDFAQEQAIRACFVDADKIRASFTSAKERIVVQATEAADALVDFDNMRRETERAVANGTAQLDREEGRAFGGYAFHYWYDEKVTRYQREFKWAKRLVFLAMRAVEYEFQQTLPLRKDVFTATHPDQLEAALRALQQEVATRAINRRRPEQASVVVSLRDDVLGLQNKTNAPVGERAYSSSLIFRSRIWDPRYAVRDATGNYLGQGVPFTLAPQGTLVNRCAERLWRVTATIQGDGLSQAQPGAPVMVLKANTFESQWCDGHEQPGLETQVGTLQPSRNLFKDPQSSPATDESSHYSAAELYPWFNVRRADFYREEYLEGASEELAGRGLYGDYVLLFPRELLEGHTSVVRPPDGEVGVSVSDEEFPLDHVEDVLLRFDYLSVDNYPEVGN